MSRRRQTRTAGYTLLEMLAYITIFSVVVGLASSLFVSATRLRMLGNDAMDRMQTLREMGDAFTEEVQMSTGVSPRAGAYATSPDTLVLTLPGTRRFAVIGLLRGDDRLVLMRFSETSATPEYVKTFGEPVHRVMFTRQDGGAVAMDIDLTDSTKQNDAVHRFVATPRSRRGGSS